MNFNPSHTSYTPSPPRDYAYDGALVEPRLLVVVDTEEGFDWDAPLSSERYTLTAMDRINRVQALFDKHKIRPTYVIDYPVASEITAFGNLLDVVSTGRCTIGAQLHPWVNPPLIEEINYRNSFPGNLPRELEREKLQILTDIISRNLGVRPQVYKAGRYGIGPHTQDTLRELDYLVDLSVSARREYLREGGPDFRAISSMPYWLDRPGGLLEIPVTCGFYGLLAKNGPALYRYLNTGFGRSTHLVGLAARLHLLNRVSISPEGHRLSEAKRVTRVLLSRGQKIFTLAFHSSSLEPGNTPYVRSEKQADQLCEWLDSYLEYFLHEIGGWPTTPLEVRDMLAAAEEQRVDINRSRKETPFSMASDRIVIRNASGGWHSSLRESAKSVVERSIGLAFRTRPLRDWPAWVAGVMEMKVPATVVPNSVRETCGSANINIILDLLDRTRHVTGDIAECGVFRGATLLALGLYAEQQALGKTVYGFDSFMGFNAEIANDLALPGAFDSEKREGGFSNTSVRLVQRRIRALGLSHRIQLVPGYFKDTLVWQKRHRFSFVHLDCDTYESYRVCLEHFYVQMSAGGIILFDEYNDPPWPGCNKAVDEFLATTAPQLGLMKIERDHYEKYFIQTRER